MTDGGIINSILNYGPVFLLIAVRAFAMIQSAPVLSSEAIPLVAKFALAGLASFAVLPTAEAFAVELTTAGEAGVVGVGAAQLPAPGGLHLLTDLRYETFSLGFALLVIGEAVIGIILGFFLTIIFAAFTTAGQFFSLQMGFAASAAFDPLAQVENPIIGQFLHLIAMLVFVVIGGFQDFFLGGFWRSVQSLSMVALVEGREPMIAM
ncbi:MAG: flagellar biosynthetic protein FliR, partial [Treponema sp.]|nr:flagellar biosynthetic protein FliR [Treponema sp.]